MFTRKRLKFAAIVKAAFETNSEEQREIFGLGIFQQKMPDVGSELASFEQRRFHPPSLTPVRASFARSSNASSSAGCPSSGDVTRISTPSSASVASRTSFGRSRCICVPNVRKYG